MSYEGTTRKDLLPTELSSVKRLRESAGRLPDGSGFFTATVHSGPGKKKESTEGGPGSGPRPHGGSGKQSSKDKSTQRRRGYGEGQMPPGKVAKDAEKAAAYLKGVPGFHSTAIAAARVAQQIRNDGEVTLKSAKALVAVYDKGNEALDRHEQRYGQTSKSDKALDVIDALLDHGEAYGAKVF